MRPVSYERLLNLAHRRAIDGKGGLAASIAKMCLDSRANLSAEELQLTFEILRQLIDKVELEIRRYISDYLAKRDDVPQDLINFLANDKINIAYPILAHSTLLDDDQLINIIAENGQGHHMAIAERPDLSEKVSAALTETRDVEVIIRLIKNFTANISAETFSQLTEASRRNSAYCDVLARRHDLPVELAERMYSWVGETVQHYMMQHFNIAPDIVRDSIDLAVDEAAQNGFAAGMDRKEEFSITREQTDDLIKALHDQGIKGFIAAFSTVTGFSRPATKNIFSPYALETIAIACKAIGFQEKPFFYLIKMITHNADQDRYYNTNELKWIHGYFKNLDYQETKFILSQWKNELENQWQ